AAARRGALVRILLDSVFDDPGDVRSNTATCTYVNDIAATESLDLACQIGNPTGNGIHNKMVLVLDEGQGLVHTGSINGSENSSKNNRELAVQVESTAAYHYLADVFWHDWGLRNSVYLPLILSNLAPGAGTVDVRIEEIVYDPPGPDVDGEYVLIQNYGDAVEMTGWTLRDEVNHTYTFPVFTLADGTSVRVWTGPGVDTDTDLYWGRASAIWNNDGDTAYLNDHQGALVDTYDY
ncbi:MAG: lamin tail domain-containing protein, partial [Anaerolineae bacterium]